MLDKTLPQQWFIVSYWQVTCVPGQIRAEKNQAQGQRKLYFTIYSIVPRILLSLYRLQNERVTAIRALQYIAHTFLTWQERCYFAFKICMR